MPFPTQTFANVNSVIAPPPAYTSATGTGRGGATASTRGGAAAPTFSAAAYGSVPNPTPIPQSIYQEAQAADPALAGLGSQSDSVIGGQLAGTLSPETINSIQDNAAQFGVSSGMPGSGLEGHAGLRNLGLNVEQLQNQGLGNYQSALKNLASMQLDPSLVSSIGTYNNALASAPNPAAAAAQEEALWQSHYAQTRGPAGATGTGPTTVTGAGMGFHPYNVGGASTSGQPYGGGVYSNPSPDYTNPPIAYGPGGGPNTGAGFGEFQDPSLDPAGEMFA